MDTKPEYKTSLEHKKSKGDGYIFITGISLASIITVGIVLIWVIISNGLGLFWPKALVQLELTSGTQLLGEHQQTAAGQNNALQEQFKIGNRDLYGLDFRWIPQESIASRSNPKHAITLERAEYGNFYGFFADHATESFAEQRRHFETLAEEVAARQLLYEEIALRLKSTAQELEQTRNTVLELRYEGLSETSPQLARTLRQKQVQEESFTALEQEQINADQHLHELKVLFEDVNGKQLEIAVASITRVYFPNQLTLGDKLGIYFSRLYELISENPREANTEGGIFPAIFGTVMMILLMSLFSFPLGVVAAIYLREYAKPGLLVQCARIAVSNLAGVPSIIYGIFGLGFLIYGVGSGIDELFYPERLPRPTFGTGGILWASITLGLLTVPVVIVSTEEALSTIPPGVREGSYALGATKLQTLIKLVIPLASPGMMTGFILAMARAAGEVAPLMITGVVKLAPSLPLDGNYPFFHPERKFMHLGFHIFDVGFQSPNVEAAKPMVYTTTFLLVIIVLCMSILAIILRERLKRRFSGKAF